MRQWGVNILPKVVAQQRHGRGSNQRPLDRKSDALPLSHGATVEFYLYPTVGTVLIHSVKPELTE